MATNWDLPINITPYADVLALIRSRDDDLAKMFDPSLSATPSTPVAGWKRWNNNNRRWEKFDNAAWTALAEKYNMSIDGTASNVTDVVAIANGGTGASTIAQARTNLNLGALAVLSTINNSNWSGTVLSIANGGTSANTIAGARSNLEVPSVTGAGASGTWDIGISGNSATATTFSTNRSNYMGVTNSAVSGQLMWKNYGNGHTIFDASNGTSPDGGDINQSNAANAWSATYPTLMGWNGSSTCGVRVDSARVADTLSSTTFTLSYGSALAPSLNFLAPNSNSGIYARTSVYGSVTEVSGVGLSLYGQQCAMFGYLSADVGGVSISTRLESNNRNIALGTASLNSISYSTATDNIAIGSSALYTAQAPLRSIAIGSSAMYYATAVADCTAIGHLAMSSSGSLTNSTAIGAGAPVTGSNQVQLGNSYTTTYIYGAIQNRSDARDKTDIRDTQLGLDFIKALRPVDYRWDYREDYRTKPPEFDLQKPEESASKEEKLAYQAAEQAHKTERDAWLDASKLANIVRDGSKKRTRYHHGLIAQEVKAVLDEKGVDFGGFQDHGIKGGDDVLSIGYVELIAPMIKAIQEQQALIESQKSAIESLTARITALEAK